MDEKLDWINTQSHWDRFLEDVRLARGAVGATYAGAWFRGQTHEWSLTPSLYRRLPELESEIVKLKEKMAIYEGKLEKARAFLQRRALSSDDEVTKRLAASIDLFRKQLSRLEQRKPIDGHMPGEGRAFVEFRFRSASHHQSSWQTLAEMQHYGVPTRLLDWTESFIHALAFALEKYAAKLTLLWTKDRYSEEPAKLLRFHMVHVDHTLHHGSPIHDAPTIWILNPYKLAEASKGKNVLWDPTLNTSDDYFRLFVDDHPDLDRRFTSPIPILSPWRDERVAAQRGVFTCHGKDTRPLNEQLSSRVVRSVKLTPEAAIHGVRFLSEVGGLDRFAMFRDRDSLGRKTRDEFLSLPLQHKEDPTTSSATPKEPH
jgi:hypothetical protein